MYIKYTTENTYKLKVFIVLFILVYFSYWIRVCFWNIYLFNELFVWIYMYIYKCYDCVLIVLNCLVLAILFSFLFSFFVQFRLILLIS